MQDLIAGNVQMAFDTLAALQPHLKSGALRPLAIAGLERSAALPGVPVLAEDLEGFDASPLSYVSVRSGTPAAVVERVNREVNAVLSTPEVRARLAELGIAVSPCTPEDIARQVATERDKWRKVIEASGAKLE
jgi:tripartite-type tricarboxylate transporter receptor subunit TctC